MGVYISTCMFLLYSIGNKMCVAQDNRNVTFCETEDNIEINCPQNTTIAIQFLTTAQDTNNDDCLRHFNSSLRDQCSGNSNCDVSVMESPLNSCRLIPKFLKVSYTCFCRFLIFQSEFSRVTEVSAADMSKISCDCNFTFRKMEINHVEPDEGSCKKCSIKEVKISVSNLCKKERTCSSPQNDDSLSCLFHPRYARIHYSCQEEKNGTSILPEGTTELKLTTEPPNSNVSNYSTTNTVKEHTTRIYDYDTQETSTVTYGSTDSIETKAVVQLDTQGRVLIYDPDANKSVTVCGNHWYADAASVLCKYLHKSSYGIARKLLKHHLYTTVELKFQCTGNEMSLFDCNNTFVGMNCSVSTVAAVICCPDDDSSECSSNTKPKSNAMPSTGLNIGVVIGIVIGALLIACLVIVIVIFIRRSIGPKKKNKPQRRDSSKNDYTGIQVIAMPIANEHRPPYPGLEMETRDDQYHDISDINNDSNKNISDPSKYVKPNNKNKNVGDQRSHNDFAIPDQSNETVIISNSHSTVDNYVVLDPNETGFNRSEGPDKMNGSYELAQPIHHIDHSKDSKWKRKSNDVYAHSVEGMYDSSNDNRHKESESNIYSRAIDNVYDSSCHTRKNGKTEDNYDHFTDKKIDDDYDISQI